MQCYLEGFFFPKIIQYDNFVHKYLVRMYFFCLCIINCLSYVYSRFTRTLNGNKYCPSVWLSEKRMNYVKHCKLDHENPHHWLNYKYMSLSLSKQILSQDSRSQDYLQIFFEDSFNIGKHMFHHCFLGLLPVLAQKELLVSMRNLDHGCILTHDFQNYNA